MYKIAFLKPCKKYNFFAKQLCSLENFEINICGFDYESLSNFNVYDYDLIILGVCSHNLDDIEIFLDNIKLFYSGCLLAIDDEFSMKRKFVFEELGVKNYFYMPLEFTEFVEFLPWYINKRENVIKYKDIILNTDNRTICRGNDCLSLKNMEFRLMKFLLQNKGKIMSKDRILSEVWDMNSLVCSKTVEVHMCRLRKKIDKGFEYKLLHTVPNTGYMLR